MNTRKAIQSLDQPAVLSLRFSQSTNRFTAGLADGFRLFCTQNCVTLYRPQLPLDGGVALIDALDDRHLAYVGGGRVPASSPNVVIFWDIALGREVTRFDLHEPILGLRLTSKWMAVVLEDRTVLFAHQELNPAALSLDQKDLQLNLVIKAPNLVRDIYSTSPNLHAVIHLDDDLLILPSPTIGQIYIIPLVTGSRRVLRVASSALRYLTVSSDGTLLATASVQGTLIRVFAIKTLDQVAEFRRGMDSAIISGLYFSGTNRWLACTSDKGTLHVYDLRPPPPSDRHPSRSKQAQVSRKSNPYQRLSSQDRDTFSTISGRSTPVSAVTAGYQGSIQEYYGLRAPPLPGPQPGQGTGISAMAALRSSPLAPKALRDVRSVASAPFYMGNDGPHWQGGQSHSWITTPNGTRKRVSNPISPRPGDPVGRPPKGIVVFGARDANKDPTDESEVIYVVGGGSDARWEMFELLPADDGNGWGLVNRGFRRYLTKQFAE